MVDETAEYSTAWDLPSVDDLEVAAAAAAAALDIFAPPPKAVSSDEDSSDEVSKHARYLLATPVPKMSRKAIHIRSS